MGEDKVMGLKSNLSAKDKRKEIERKLGELDIKMAQKKERIKKRMAAPANTSSHEAKRLEAKKGKVHKMSKKEKQARKDRKKRLQRIRLAGLKGDLGKR